MAKIGKELREYFDSQGIKQTEVAKMIGVKPPYITKIFSDEREIGKNQVEKWITQFGFNKAWLLTGEGEMLKTNVQDDQIKEIPLEEAHNYPDGSLIPYFGETQTKGGLDNYQIPTDIVEYPTSMIKAGDIFIKATSAIKHIGESMAEYPSGCVFSLLLDIRLSQLHRLNHLQAVTYLQLDGKIKHILKDAIRAYSTNTETYPDGALVYAPFDIPKSKIMRMHKVLGYSCKVE